MPSNDDLQYWLQAVALRADRQAFARLFEHFAPRVKSFMLRAGCPADVAEDIAQETLVAVWRKAALFQPGRANVSTWIFTIARNLRIDLHRRRGGLGERVEWDPEQDRTSTEGVDTPQRPEEQVCATQRGERVRRAMAQLPREQALIVRLSFFEEQPHAEIAQALKLPLGTVKSRIRLAVGALRRLLGEFE